jgi:hypothetical protein
VQPRPAALQRELEPCAVLGRAALELQLIFPMWMRPSCTGSTELDGRSDPFYGRFADYLFGELEPTVADG